MLTHSIAVPLRKSRHFQRFHLCQSIDGASLRLAAPPGENNPESTSVSSDHNVQESKIKPQTHTQLIRETQQSVKVGPTLVVAALLRRLPIIKNGQTETVQMIHLCHTRYHIQTCSTGYWLCYQNRVAGKF